MDKLPTLNPRAIREIGTARRILNEQIVGYHDLDIIRPDQTIGQVDSVIVSQTGVDIRCAEASDVVQRLAGHRIDIGCVDRKAAAA